jgi:hypothetical protein
LSDIFQSIPGDPVKTQIESIYGAEEAFKVIDAGIADYKNHFKK